MTRLRSDREVALLPIISNAETTCNRMILMKIRSLKRIQNRKRGKKT